MAALHSSGKFKFVDWKDEENLICILDVKLFSNNNEDVEVDEEEEDEIEDEQSYEKDEDMSDNSEQNIDLLEN